MLTAESDSPACQSSWPFSDRRVVFTVLEHVFANPDNRPDTGIYK